MKRFHCGCGQEIFFENTHCEACGSQLGFDSDTCTLISVKSDRNGWKASNVEDSRRFHFCSHREHIVGCNWLIPPERENAQCISCASTRTIPKLNKSANWRRWRTLESAKRRMLYSLLKAGLPLRTLHEGEKNGLVFDFLEDKRTNPTVKMEHVLSGHAKGVITVNAAEADDSYREAAREAMNEPYRTLLGHFRHEVGHFYWDELIKDSKWLKGFRKWFGHETVDYQDSIDRYYAEGAEEDWRQRYISAYASAHPLEDWAETWSHYLLMMDTLETAKEYGLITAVEGGEPFENWIGEWMQLPVLMNALNRSIGQHDAYPFVLSEQVKKKLKFIHDLIATAV
jgi:hypothetical protein